VDFQLLYSLLSWSAEGYHLFTGAARMHH